MRSRGRRATKPLNDLPKDMQQLFQFLKLAEHLYLTILSYRNVYYHTFISDYIIIHIIIHKKLCTFVGELFYVAWLFALRTLRLGC